MRKCGFVSHLGIGRSATEGGGGNLFALGAQQRQQAKRRQQQRAKNAQACEGCVGGLLKMRLHFETIPQLGAAFKSPRLHAKLA